MVGKIIYIAYRNRLSSLEVGNTRFFYGVRSHLILLDLNISQSTWQKARGKRQKAFKQGAEVQQKQQVLQRQGKILCYLNSPRHLSIWASYFLSL